jgi:hypothetical protein
MTAIPADGRKENKFSPQRAGSGNMDQMIIDFLFPNAHGLRNVFGRPFLFFQHKDYGLTDRSHRAFSHLWSFSLSPQTILEIPARGVKSEKGLR